MSGNIKQAAMTYAAHGWPVLRCWTTEDGDCACPPTSKGRLKNNGVCKSPGKHPYKSAHGVKDATTDLDIISGWRGQYNIGISLGHKGLLALDLDVLKVARAVAGTDSVKETGRVRTRRGLHVYFLLTGDMEVTARDIYDRTTGEEIGQIRGLNHYVVAPPSRTKDGKRYRFLGDLVDDWTPRLTTTDDANAYTAQLLKEAGYDVEISRSVKQGEIIVQEGDVRIADGLPEELRSVAALREIRLMLTGQVSDPYDSENRSISIHKCGVKIAYVAATQHYRMTEHELASVIKALDRAYFHKYEDGRSELMADKEYVRSAHKALKRAAEKSAGGDDLVETAPIDSGQGLDIDLSEGNDVEDDGYPDSGDQQYMWDADGQQLLYVQQRANGRSLRPIANYLAEILATAVIDDPDETEHEVAWRLRAVRGQTERSLSLRRKDYGRSRTLAERLTGLLPHNFSINQGGEEHILAAIKELSAQDVPERRVPSVPGWYEREDGAPVYVLPGAEDALSAGGIEQSFQLHRDDLSDEDPMRYAPLENYGVGVGPPKDKAARQEAWRAFRSLLACAPGAEHVVAAVVFQVLGGALFDGGVREVPPLVHIVGRTGTLKTALSLAALGLMGKFSDSAPTTWRSTPLGLGQALNRARHMTLLIDDYKRAVGMRRDMVGLIQQYADGSHMVRHSLSGAPFERPRGLILSNGEDRFRGEASVAARTTSLEVKKDDIDGPLLAVVQQDAEEGRLAQVGAMWLQWVAASGLLEDETIREVRLIAQERLLAAEGIVPGHRRMLRSVASLLSIGEMVKRFVEETSDSKVTRIAARRALRLLEEHFVETSQDRAEEIEELSPLDHLVGFLREKCSAGESKFRARSGIGEDIPSRPTARVVGWYEHDRLYLSEHLTFAFYQEEMSRRREEVAHDWSSIAQDIREKYGKGSAAQIYTRSIEDAETGVEGEKTTRRVYSIPRGLVLQKRRQRRKDSKS